MTYTCLPRCDIFQPSSTPTQRRLSTFNLTHAAIANSNSAAPDNRYPLQRDQPLRPYPHQRGFVFQTSTSTTRRHPASVPVPTCSSRVNNLIAWVASPSSGFFSRVDWVYSITHVWHVGWVATPYLGFLLCKHRYGNDLQHNACMACWMGCDALPRISPS